MPKLTHNRTIFNDLLDKLLNPKNQIICLHGSVGSGKTFLLKSLSQKIDATWLTIQEVNLAIQEKNKFENAKTVIIDDAIFFFHEPNRTKLFLNWLKIIKSTSLVLNLSHENDIQLKDVPPEATHLYMESLSPEESFELIQNLAEDYQLSLSKSTQNWLEKIAVNHNIRSVEGIIKRLGVYCAIEGEKNFVQEEAQLIQKFTESLNL